MTLPSQLTGIEAALTWGEANHLRIITGDHHREVRAWRALAREEGLPTRAHDAKCERAARLEAKVLAMFYRLSEER